MVGKVTRPKLIKNVETNITLFAPEVAGVTELALLQRRLVVLGYTSLDGKTPGTNRGLISQNVDIALGIDFYHLALRAVPDLSHFYGIVSQLEDFYSDRLEIRPYQKMQFGRTWDGGSVSSVRGIRVYWSEPGCGKPGQLLLVVPAKPIRSQTQKDNATFLLGLIEDYQGEFTRFDIALDDYGKRLNFDAVIESLHNEDYFYVNSFDIRESGKRSSNVRGRTIYMGSRQSSKMLRLYDKSVESKGEVDSYRLELELKGDHAKLVGDAWCKMVLEPDEVVSRWLSSLILGAIDFRKRLNKNRERCPILDWWADFCAAVDAAGLRLTLPKKEGCLVRSMDALEFQYGPTFAMIAAVLGDAFEPYIEQLKEAGKQRLGSRHRAIIGLAKAE